ncbi:MAG: MFS transporter [Rubricella sp.]
MEYGDHMRLLVSFVALFSSFILVQLSSGALLPIDALTAHSVAMFSTAEAGLLGTGHFLGFLLGCMIGPRLIGSIGHNRAFAVFVVAGTAGILGHTLIVTAEAWAALRVLAGLSIAGTYTVVESWMHPKLTNGNRGRALFFYRMVDLLALSGSQAVVALLAPGAYVTYTILALVCVSSMLPLALSRMPAPMARMPLRVQPGLALRLSPLGAAGTFAAGFTMASLLAMGPLYLAGAAELSLQSVAIGIAGAILIGGIAQLPLGFLSEWIDRRVMIMALAAVVIFTGILLGLGGERAMQSPLLLFIVFGAAAMPIYGIAAAHANDFTPDDAALSLNATLMFYLALGAVIGPATAGIAMERYGLEALFLVNGGLHGALLVLAAIRSRARPVPEERTYYTWRPSTTFIFERLFYGTGR